MTCNITLKDKSKLQCPSCVYREIEVHKETCNVCKQHGIAFCDIVMAIEYNQDNPKIV